MRLGRLAECGVGRAHALDPAALALTQAELCAAAWQQCPGHRQGWVRAAPHCLPNQAGAMTLRFPLGCPPAAVHGSPGDPPS